MIMFFLLREYQEKTYEPETNERSKFSRHDSSHPESFSHLEDTFSTQQADQEDYPESTRSQNSLPPCSRRAIEAHDLQSSRLKRVISAMSC